MKIKKEFVFAAAIVTNVLTTIITIKAAQEDWHLGLFVTGFFLLGWAACQSSIACVRILKRGMIAAEYDVKVWLLRDEVEIALEQSQAAATQWVRDLMVHDGEITRENPCDVCERNYLTFQRAAYRAAELLEAQHAMGKVAGILGTKGVPQYIGTTGE